MGGAEAGLEGAGGAVLEGVGGAGLEGMGGAELEGVGGAELEGVGGAELEVSVCLTRELEKRVSSSLHSLAVVRSTLPPRVR